MVIKTLTMEVVSKIQPVRVSRAGFKDFLGFSLGAFFVVE
jgi:hypothetical protein